MQFSIDVKNRYIWLMQNVWISSKQFEMWNRWSVCRATISANASQKWRQESRNENANLIGKHFQSKQWKLPGKCYIKHLAIEIPIELIAIALQKQNTPYIEPAANSTMISSIFVSYHTVVVVVAFFIYVWAIVSHKLINLNNSVAWFISYCLFQFIPFYYLHFVSMSARIVCGCCLFQLRKISFITIYGINLSLSLCVAIIIPLCICVCCFSLIIQIDLKHI